MTVKNVKNSVAKGGLSVSLARMLGMACSFVLFIAVARHSSVDAGIFRSVLTYIIISEFLGILGLQRWLAIEMANSNQKRGNLFLATTLFTIIVCIVLSFIYFGISLSNIYSPDLSSALRLGALAVVPSGIYACVQSGLIGMGFSHSMGLLNMAENVVRSIIAIVMLYLGFSILTLIAVFVVCRWVIAIVGFYVVSNRLEIKKWEFDLDCLQEVIHQSPKFATIMLAFLIVKNSGMVLLPALVNEVEAASYAVAYQIYDLALLIPSVMALTSSNLFTEKAAKSKAGLRWAAMQLSAITSLLIFPFIAMGILFSGSFIHLVFGNRYENSSEVLNILLIAVMFSIVDQVLSQVMITSKKYNDDKNAILLGAVVVIPLIVLLTPQLGASGTALALLISTVVTVGCRFYLIPTLFGICLLWISIRKQFISAAIAGGLVYFFVWFFDFESIERVQKIWILIALVGLLLNAVILYWMNGFSAAKRSRMKKFLLSR